MSDKEKARRKRKPLIRDDDTDIRLEALDVALLEESK